MYYYIVDPQKLNQSQFERVQYLLYSSLSEYHVTGEVVRVTGLRTIGQLVENAIARGTKTMVAVGTDETLHDVINAVKGREVVVGFIPLAESEIGGILGITDVVSGAKTIGQRRIAELDLGVVNQNYYVARLSFGLGQNKNPGGRLAFLNLKLIRSLFKLPTFEVKFSADSQYQASLKVIGGMIVNSLTKEMLDVSLLPQLTMWQTITYRSQILSGKYESIPGSSLIHVKKIQIDNPVGLPLRVGSRIIAKTPATIEIVPKALKIIVGKDRTF